MSFMSRNLQLDVGDVFRFAAVDGYGMGQIILSEIALYIVIFEPLLNELETENLEPLFARQLLAGWTQDAHFFHGRWMVTQRSKRLARIQLPEFKVGFQEKTWVTNVRGKLLREASADEERSLEFQWSSSPIAFVEAFTDHHLGKPRQPRHKRLFIS